MRSVGADADLSHFRPLGRHPREPAELRWRQGSTRSGVRLGWLTISSARWLRSASAPTLLEQQAALGRAIERARAADKAEAVTRVRHLMAAHGLTAADLVAKSTARPSGAGKKVQPKYQDPVSGATWTGRGLKPKWLQAALATGKSVTDFSI
jgi:DNA-binding protein H-NS